MNTSENRIAALLSIPADGGVYALLNENDRVAAVISYKPINKAAYTSEGVYDAIEAHGRSNGCFTGGTEASSDTLKLQFAQRFLVRHGDKIQKKGDLLAAFGRLSAIYKCDEGFVTAGMLESNGTLNAASWTKVGVK